VDLVDGTREFGFSWILPEPLNNDLVEIRRITGLDPKPLRKFACEQRLNGHEAARPLHHEKVPASNRDNIVILGERIEQIVPVEISSAITKVVHEAKRTTPLQSKQDRDC
jgi:hypothetical protein